MFEIAFAEGWDIFYSKMDRSWQKKIWKKIEKLKEKISARHLKHGLPFFVVESGQDRICFEESEKKRIIMFAGNHKQYEQWYGKMSRKG